MRPISFLNVLLLLGQVPLAFLMLQSQTSASPVGLSPEETSRVQRLVRWVADCSVSTPPGQSIEAAPNRWQVWAGQHTSSFPGIDRDQLVNTGEELMRSRFASDQEIGAMLLDLALDAANTKQVLDDARDRAMREVELKNDFNRLMQSVDQYGSRPGLTLMELLMELEAKSDAMVRELERIKIITTQTRNGIPQQFGQTAPGVVGTVHFALELETIQRHLQQASQSLDLSARATALRDGFRELQKLRRTLDRM